jgi:hypothetical protein
MVFIVLCNVEQFTAESNWLLKSYTLSSLYRFAKLRKSAVELLVGNKIIKSAILRIVKSFKCFMLLKKKQYTKEITLSWQKI